MTDGVSRSAVRLTPSSRGNCVGGSGSPAATSCAVRSRQPAPRDRRSSPDHGSQTGARRTWRSGPAARASSVRTVRRPRMMFRVSALTDLGLSLSTSSPFLPRDLPDLHGEPTADVVALADRDHPHASVLGQAPGRRVGRGLRQPQSRLFQRVEPEGGDDVGRFRHQAHALTIARAVTVLQPATWRSVGPLVSAASSRSGDRNWISLVRCHSTPQRRFRRVNSG